MTIAERIERILTKYKRTPAEIMWVGSFDGTYSLSWEQFANGPGKASVVGRSYYGSGNDCKVATDLVVVGDGWWIARTPATSGKFMMITPPVFSPEAKPFSVCRLKSAFGANVETIRTLEERDAKKTLKKAEAERVEAEKRARALKLTARI